MSRKPFYYWEVKKDLVTPFPGSIEPKDSSGIFITDNMLLKDTMKFCSELFEGLEGHRSPEYLSRRNK